MDVHHVGQLLDADFEASVEFYRDAIGLSLRETTDGTVRVAFFETGSAEFHLIVREARGSPADPLLDAVRARSAAHVAFEVPDLASAMADADEARLGRVAEEPESGLGPYRRAFVAPGGTSASRSSSSSRSERPVEVGRAAPAFGVQSVPEGATCRASRG